MNRKHMLLGAILIGCSLQPLKAMEGGEDDPKETPKKPETPKRGGFISGLRGKLADAVKRSPTTERARKEKKEKRGEAKPLSLASHEGVNDLLFRAAARDSEATVTDVLAALNAGANFAAVNDQGDSAFHVTVINNNVRGLTVLLHERPEGATLRNRNQETFFLLASRTGREGIVRHFVRNMPEILSHVDARDNSALHLAIHAGLPNIANILLDAGVPVDRKNKAGKTPLHMLLRKIHFKEGSSKSRIKKYIKSLTKLIKRMIETCPTVLMRADRNGDMPLHLAIMSDQILFLYAVLADVDPTVLLGIVDLPNREGQTPRMLAASRPLMLSRIETALNVPFDDRTSQIRRRPAPVQSESREREKEKEVSKDIPEEDFNLEEASVLEASLEIRPETDQEPVTVVEGDDDATDVGLLTDVDSMIEDPVPGDRVRGTSDTIGVAVIVPEVESGSNNIVPGKLDPTLPEKFAPPANGEPTEIEKKLNKKDDQPTNDKPSKLKKAFEKATNKVKDGTKKLKDKLNKSNKGVGDSIESQPPAAPVSTGWSRSRLAVGVGAIVAFAGVLSERIYGYLTHEEVIEKVDETPEVKAETPEVKSEEAPKVS